MSPFIRGSAGAGDHTENGGAVEVAAGVARGGKGHEIACSVEQRVAKGK